MTMRLPPRKGALLESSLNDAFRENRARHKKAAAIMIAKSMPGSAAGSRRGSVIGCAAGGSRRTSMKSNLSASRQSSGPTLASSQSIASFGGDFSTIAFGNIFGNVLEDVPDADTPKSQPGDLHHRKDPLLTEIDKKLDHLIAQLAQYHASICQKRLGSEEATGGSDWSPVQPLHRQMSEGISVFSGASEGGSDIMEVSVIKPPGELGDISSPERKESKESHDRGGAELMSMKPVWNHLPLGQSHSVKSPQSSTGLMAVPGARVSTNSADDASSGTCTPLGVEAANAAVRAAKIAELKEAKLDEIEQCGWIFPKTPKLASISVAIRIIMCDPDSGSLGRAYAAFMPVYVLLSLMPTMLQSSPDFRGEQWNLVEVFSEVLFLLDILLRFCVCPQPRHFFKESSHNIIDVLVVMPLLLRAFLGFTPSAEELDELPGSLLLYAVPLLRLLKTLRGFRKFNLIFTVAVQVYMDTLPAGFMLMYIILFFGAVIYYVEPRDNIEDYPKALWYVCVTITTVGYGDVVPISTAGRLVGTAIVCSSVFVLAFPIGIIGTAVAEIWKERDMIILRNWTKERLDYLGYEADDIPEFFKAFDNDGNGILDYHEFCDMLERFALGVKSERTRQLFKSFDEDGSGTVDAEEFVLKLYPAEYERLYPRDPVKRRSTFGFGSMAVKTSQVCHQSALA